MQDFVHLHVHSQYSILDGQASIPRLVDKAIADGMRGIAITDHGNMFAIKEFWNYVKKKNGARRDKVKQTSAAIADLQAFYDYYKENHLKLCRFVQIGKICTGNQGDGRIWGKVL